MSDKHKASHFYLQSDQGVQNMLRVLIYHLVGLVRLLRKGKPCFEFVSWGEGTITEVCGIQRWVEPCEFVIYWESLQSLFSGKNDIFPTE